MNEMEIGVNVFSQSSFNLKNLPVNKFSYIEVKLSSYLFLNGCQIFLFYVTTPIKFFTHAEEINPQYDGHKYKEFI